MLIEKLRPVKERLSIGKPNHYAVVTTVRRLYGWDLGRPSYPVTLRESEEPVCRLMNVRRDLSLIWQKGGGLLLSEAASGHSFALLASTTIRAIVTDSEMMKRTRGLLEMGIYNPTGARLPGVELSEKTLTQIGYFVD
jgi:hypothetical protein